MDSLIGKKLDGRYLILELIGAGGMANVYKATDVLEDRTVAVKVLREEFLDNEELVRRFKNESKAISMLSHPNIVKVYDVNFSDAVQFIVMEYIDGINFMQYLESQGKLEWKEAIHFSIQVLRALQHAHDRGIVHRDIKPQNIMILRDGSIKVMDFGIARFSRSQTRTITDKAIGSVHYISPEQARGEETDAKSDIYSLGVMLYEMLTGKLPFESDSPVSVALKQISDDPQHPREIAPEIPEALEEITLKAMAKEPSDRYQSATEMLLDIDEFKKNPSIKFEYKYHNTDSETKYFSVVDKASKGKGGSKAAAKSATKGEKKRRGWAVPALLGVTLACFIGSLLLTYMVFTSGERSIFNNNIDVALPDYTGMTVEEVKANPDYARKFNFKIVEDFNNTVERGKIITQDPMPPKTVKDNATITLHVSKGIEFVTVPSVIDATYDEAFQLLTKNNLAIKIEMVSEGKTENRVVRTNPAAGEVVEAYSVVTVYVQKPTSNSYNIYVPKLVGQQFSKASLAITANGLALGEVKEEYSDTVEAGIVISQSIAENTSVALNTKINLVVSLGKKPFDMILNVTGFSPYTLSVTVNGNAVTMTNGSATIPAKEGDNLVIIIKVTNPATNTSFEITKTEKMTNHNTVVDIDVTSSIPSDWLPPTGGGGGGGSGGGDTDGEENG